MSQITLGECCFCKAHEDTTRGALKGVCGHEVRSNKLRETVCSGDVLSRCRSEGALRVHLVRLREGIRSVQNGQWMDLRSLMTAVLSTACALHKLHVIG